MKFYAFIFVFLSVALGAYAYQTGVPNRANFASGQQPASQKNDNYRAFSNYNNRGWGQGVQTQPVRTEVAGTSAVDFDKNTPQKLVSKTQATTPAASAASAATKSAVATAKPAAAPATAQQPTQEAAAAAAANNVDPAAMMQQMQGMVSAMSSMTGAGGANGQAAATNMPDISALMGGSIPAAAPAKK